MAVWHRTSAKSAYTLLVIATGLAIAVVSRKVLVVLVFALFFSYLMEPMIYRAQSWMRGSRIKGVAITYLAFWILAGAFFAFIGVKAVQEARAFASQAPQAQQKLESGEIAKEFGQKHGLSAGLQERGQKFLQGHRANIEQLQRRLLQLGRTYAIAFTWVLLVPLLAMFFPERKMLLPTQVAEATLSGGSLTLTRAVLQDIDLMLAEYMWAQFLLSVFAFIAFAVVLGIMRVPYALLFAVISAVLELIPIVGPLVTATVIMSTLLLTGYQHWLVVLVFLALWRVVQDYVNTPLLMKAELELHPLAILSAVLIGGEVGGGLGMFVSIPVAAAVRLFWRRYQQIQQLNAERDRLSVAEDDSRDLKAA
jgi:predicted PurR-regulated permease PerM